MKRFLLTFFLVLAFALFACTGDSAKELFDTARFEEVQNNKEHAIELYEEIVKKHPKSEYAKRAEERLKELKEKTGK